MPDQEDLTEWTLPQNSDDLVAFDQLFMSYRAHLGLLLLSTVYYYIESKDIITVEKITHCWKLEAQNR